MKSPVYWEEIDPLWNVMDAALKRVPRDSMDGSGGGAAVMGGSLQAQDLLGPLRAIAIQSKESIAILDEDKKILFVNSQFEEITGTRLEGNEGQVLTQVVREQAFGSLLTDLYERAHPGSEGASEDFEFSGVQFKVHCVSFGTIGVAKCFVITVTKQGEG
jgi:PAS domain S-box-containing protein